MARADQWGVVQLQRLLREWGELDPGDDPMTPAAWQFAWTRKVLEGDERRVVRLKHLDALLPRRGEDELVRLQELPEERVTVSSRAWADRRGSLSNEERVTRGSAGSPSVRRARGCG